MTKSIVRHYYSLNVCSSEFIFWKFNPQSHVLIPFGGRAFGSDYVMNHLRNRLSSPWISRLMERWVNGLLREWLCCRSLLSLACLICLTISPSTILYLWIQVLTRKTNNLNSCKALDFGLFNLHNFKK